jgi:dihydroflavonol-4-reductase
VVLAIKRPGANLDEVRRVFSYYSDEAGELFDLIDWVNLDMTSYPEVERVMIDIDRVYHCAAMITFNPRETREMLAFNVRSTENLVNACLETGVKRMLHVSSIATIGRVHEGFPADETLIWARGRGSTTYSVSKFKSEMEVWRGIEEGLKAVVVNPAVVLGPGFWKSGSPSLFRRVARGLKYSTTGMTGYVSVHDVVSAMTRLMETDISGERFILSAGDLTFVSVMEMIAEATGSPRKMKLISPWALRNLARLDGVRSIFTGKRVLSMEMARSAFNQDRYSATKIQEAIGFEFTPPEEAIRQVAGIYLKDQGK